MFSRRDQHEDAMQGQYELSATTPWMNLQSNENLVKHTVLGTEENKDNAHPVESTRFCKFVLDVCLGFSSGD